MKDERKEVYLPDMKEERKGVNLPEALQRCEQRKPDFFLRLSAADTVASCLAQIHREGKLYLSLIPENVVVSRYDAKRHIFEQVTLSHPSDSIAIGEASSRTTPPVYTGFSAPECRDRNGGNTSEEIGVFSDIYMFGKFLDFLFESGTDAGFYTGNGVLGSLIKTVIFTCCKSDPAYRFSTDENIQEALRYIRQAAAAYEQGYYLEVIDTAYACNLPIETCRLQPETFQAEGFHVSVQRLLKERLLTNHVDKYHALYAYLLLHDMGKLYQTFISREDKIDLVLCGMRCYNHFGESRSVMTLGKQLQKYKPAEADQVDGNLLLAVACTDTGDYEAALALARQNIQMLQQRQNHSMHDKGQTIRSHEESDDGTVETEKMTASETASLEESKELLHKLGRTYSSEGCSLARLRQEGAREAFTEAIDCFAQFPEDAAITKCHILHYACEIHDQALYEQYAADYFGAGTFARQAAVVIDTIKNAFENHETRSYFPMYALVKGFYTFACLPKQQCARNDRNKMCTEESAKETVDFSREGKEKFRAKMKEFSCLPFTDHDKTYPLSLIFFYLGLIEMEMEKDSDVPQNLPQETRTYFAMAQACNKDTGNQLLNIQMVILARIQWICNEIMHKTDQNDRIYTFILSRMHAAGWTTMEQSLREKKSPGDLLCFEEA